MCGYLQLSLIPHHHHHHRRSSGDQNTRRLRPADSCCWTGNPCSKTIYFEPLYSSAFLFRERRDSQEIIILPTRQIPVVRRTQ